MAGSWAIQWSRKNKGWQEQLQISRIRGFCELGDRRSEQVFSDLSFVYIALWMGEEAVPAAWDERTAFLTVREHLPSSPVTVITA